ATVSVNKHGLYRFDIAAGTIKVFDGNASVEIGGKTVLVGSGRLLKVEGGEPGIEKFNKDEMVALDTWCKRRGQEMERDKPSSRADRTGQPVVREAALRCRMRTFPYGPLQLQ